VGTESIRDSTILFSAAHLRGLSIFPFPVTFSQLGEREKGRIKDHVAEGTVTKGHCFPRKWCGAELGHMRIQTGVQNKGDHFGEAHRTLISTDAHRPGFLTCHPCHPYHYTACGRILELGATPESTNVEILPRLKNLAMTELTLN
jgi:hypothetical protein